MCLKQNRLLFCSSNFYFEAPSYSFLFFSVPCQKCQILHKLSVLLLNWTQLKNVFSVMLTITEVTMKEKEEKDDEEQENIVA